jgi:lipopolysaccharide transport system ATP-binding protein
MSQAVITVEGLSKRYLVAHNAESQGHGRYLALRDVLGREIRNVARKSLDMLRGRQVLQGDEVEEFWALRDVNFEIKEGAVVGIIGRNGAGKSTLLKILSRITEPTEGRVMLRGRVGSLLEVGTGFHPELTGRENIFLNGAILGMKRLEIAKKFDEIVAFAEVEKFLDTPVKHYSSGMYVRLAFAVAAHLEPDILVVDEVLGVGDTEFQQKCLGKMDEVSRREGRTVLLVSHNMAAIRSLCDLAILLENGRITQVGPVDQTIGFDSAPASANARVCFEARPDKPCITQLSVDQDALRCGHFAAQIEFVSPYPLRNPIGGILISGVAGLPVWGTNNRFDPSEVSGVSASNGILTCECKHLPLVSSTYTISAWLSDWNHDFDVKRDVLSFEFRKGVANSLRPSPTLIGYLDWPACWKFRKTVAEHDSDSPCEPFVRQDAHSELRQPPTDDC